MVKINIVQLKIPLSSPDINPIENASHLAERKLAVEALSHEILHENYIQFPEKVVKTLKSIPVYQIDHIIR